MYEPAFGHVFCHRIFGPVCIKLLSFSYTRHRQQYRVCKVEKMFICTNQYQKSQLKKCLGTKKIVRAQVGRFGDGSNVTKLSSLVKLGFRHFSKKESKKKFRDGPSRPPQGYAKVAVHVSFFGLFCENWFWFCDILFHYS